MHGMSNIKNKESWLISLQGERFVYYGRDLAITHHPIQSIPGVLFSGVQSPGREAEDAPMVPNLR
jgi:hypothetical protein